MSIAPETRARLERIVWCGTPMSDEQLVLAVERLWCRANNAEAELELRDSKLSSLEPPQPDAFGRLLALKENWDSYGAPPLDPAVVELARTFLKRVNVVPGSDGSVQLEWHTHGFDLEIEFTPEGKSTGWLQAVNDTAEVVSEPPQAQEPPVFPFVHWSKDPKVPYPGCECGNCAPSVPPQEEKA